MTDRSVENREHFNEHEPGNMKKSSLLPVLASASLLLTVECSHEPGAVDYFGQIPPGEQPEVFAPGILSLRGRFERVPAFSPLGNELFFTVTTPDWEPTIMHSVKENGKWTVPDTAFFSRKYNNSEPFFSPDGQRLYFASNRPPGTPPWNNDLWMIERSGGGWSDPIHLGPAVNSEVGEYHPAVTTDGTLYFASVRDAEKSGPDIFRCRRINGEYQKAERLNDSVNSDFQDWDPYVTPDESLLLFKSDRPGGYGGMDLYVSYRKSDGSWTTAKNAGPPVNTAEHDDAGDLSPDGKYLFFARKTGSEEMDIYWMVAGFLQDQKHKTNDPD